MNIAFMPRGGERNRASNLQGKGKLTSVREMTMVSTPYHDGILAIKLSPEIMSNPIALE
jgi:hypothetical protein